LGASSSAAPSEPAPAAAAPAAKPRQKFLRQYELIERVHAYDPTADEALLNRAYVYAMRMHGSADPGQRRPLLRPPDRGGRHPHRIPARHRDHRHGPAARRDRGHPGHQGRDRKAVRRGDRRAGRGRHQAVQAGAAGRARPPGREPAQVHPGDLQGRPRPAGQAGRPSAQHADAALHQEPGQARAHRPRDARHLRAAGPQHRLPPDLHRAGGAGLRAHQPGGPQRHHPAPRHPARRAGRGGGPGQPGDRRPAGGPACRPGSSAARSRPIRSGASCSANRSASRRCPTSTPSG
jgi:hypothetical protein